MRRILLALAVARGRVRVCDWTPLLAAALLLCHSSPARAGGLGSPGGDTCQTATAISSFPFLATGSTAIPATNTTSDVPPGCLLVPSAAGSITSTDGRDHIYALTIANTIQMSFGLSTSDDDYDPQIYLLSSCGVMSSCLHGSDQRCSVNDPVSSFCPGGSDEGFTRTLDPGTYYLYIDSFAIGGGSDYMITVPEPDASPAAFVVLAVLGACVGIRRSSGSFVGRRAA